MPPTIDPTSRVPPTPATRTPRRAPVRANLAVLVLLPLLLVAFPGPAAVTGPIPAPTGGHGAAAAASVDAAHGGSAPSVPPIVGAQRAAPAPATARASALSLPGSDWFNVTSESARALPVVEFTQGTWDAADGSILLYGGDNYVVNSAATWTYSGGNWSEPSAAGLPGALSGANLAYDPADGVVVMYGGVTSFSPLTFNDTTYTYAAGQWTAWNLTPRPSPRLAGQMAYDPSLGGVVLFGGANLTTAGPLYNDTWLYHGGAWSRLVTPVAPSPRWMGALAYDPNLGALVLYGGLNPSGFAVGDTWVFQNGSWTQLHPSASPPSLSDAAMDYDVALGHIVLTGGIDGTGTLRTDTWLFNGTAWTMVTLGHRPGPHDAGIGVYDPENGAFVVAAGNPDGSFTDLLTSPAVLGGQLPSGADVGQPIPLALATTGGTPPFAFRYDVSWGDGGSNSSTSPAMSHAYAATGTFAVRATASEPGGPTVYWNASVTVRSIPAGSIAVPVAADVGVPANFSASVIGNGGAIQVSWSLGDGATMTGTSFSHAYGAPGVFAVSAWINDSYGVSLLRTGTVQVNTTPTVSFPSAGYATDVGHALALDVQAAGGTPPYLYAWAFADGGTAAGAEPSYTFHAVPGTFAPASVVVTDAVGGHGSGTIPIAVAGALRVEIVGPTSASAGGTGNYSARVTGGTAPYGYLWTLADGITSTAAHVEAGFGSTGGPEPIQLVVTDAVGASQSAMTNVTVAASPSAYALSATTFAEVGLGVVAIAAGAVAVVLLVRRRRPPA